MSIFGSVQTAHCKHFNDGVDPLIIKI